MTTPLAILQHCEHEHVRLTPDQIDRLYAAAQDVSNTMTPEDLESAHYAQIARKLDQLEEESSALIVDALKDSRESLLALVLRDFDPAKPQTAQRLTSTIELKKWAPVQYALGEMLRMAMQRGRQDIRRMPKMEVFAATWDESEHPRHPKGDAHGGEFAPKEEGPFSESKIVDEEGGLLEVFHGTKQEFEDFDSDKSDTGEGIWFAEKMAFAKQYGPRIVRANLNVRNPLDLRESGSHDLQTWREIFDSVNVTGIRFDSALSDVTKYPFYDLIPHKGNNVEGDSNLIDRVKSSGYDGLRLPEENRGSGNVIVVWSANQAKRTGVVKHQARYFESRIERNERVRRSVATMPRAAIAYARAKELYISGAMKDDLTKQVKGILLAALKTGERVDVTVGKLRDMFDPFIGSENVSASRLATIVRTNTTEAYNHGALVEMRAVDAVMPGGILAVRYTAILDIKTTELCATLNGTLFEINDSRLDALVPPNHFNCRSILEPVIDPSKVQNKKRWIDAEMFDWAKTQMPVGFGGNK